MNKNLFFIERSLFENGASLDLARYLLGRMPPITVTRENLERDRDAILFEDQLQSEEVDKGDECAVHLASVEDD